MNIAKPAPGPFIAEAVEPHSAPPHSCVCATCGLIFQPTVGSAPIGVARLIHAKLDAAAAAVEAKMIAWRRDLHEHPELGNQETRTAGIVAAHLKSLGYEVQEGIATTGVVGVLKGQGGEGPVVALRADMDALPVAEEVDLPFASKVTTQWGGETVGVMHACGHDCHVGILMGVAEVLAELRSEWRGTVKLIFQPAEEGLPIGQVGGARVMVEQGVLADPKPDVVFGLHVTSAMPVGVVAYKPGVAMAASDTFQIIVKGSQTHGAMPWKGVDPITIGSTIVSTLQTIVSRESDINRDPTVVTVGQFKGGQRQNIISDKAELLGTARTYSAEHRSFVMARIGEIAEGVALGMRGRAEVRWGNFPYPAVVNDAVLVDRMAPSLARAAPTAIRMDFPAAGSEDFSFFSNVVPGLFFFVGIASPDDKAPAPNHSPRFRVEESGLIHGLRGMLHLVADYTESGVA